MIRLVLFLVVLSAVAIFSIIEPPPSEDIRAEAFRLLAHHLSPSHDQIPLLMEEQRLSKDSVEIVFLITSNSNHAYIPQEVLGITMVRTNKTWSIVNMQRKNN